MTMGEALRGVSSVLLDSGPVIYHLERHPDYWDWMQSFFRIRAERGILLVTSPVTLSECLVLPIRRALDELAASYKAALLDGDHIRFRRAGEEEALRAAEVRAEHNLRLPDAFQVGVALCAGCQAILTNDAAFRRVGEPRILVLDDLQP